MECVLSDMPRTVRKAAVTPRSATMWEFNLKRFTRRARRVDVLGRRTRWGGAYMTLKQGLRGGSS